MKKFKLIKYFFAPFFAILFFASNALAADMFFGADTKELRPGEIYEAKIYLSSTERVNAFEGKISFSQDNLKAEEIRDGNSLINFWIERPEEREKGIVSFSGITPGGFAGEKGYLFSIIFRAISSGNGLVEIKDAKALKNDGNGTPAKVYLKPLVYKIAGEPVISESESAKKPIIVDKDPPEEFKPEIVFIKEINGGNWFAVFATQDKGSGISRYEIKESRKYFPFFSKWIRAESPYVLKDQGLKSFVYVRAWDKAGNAKTVVAPPLMFKWYDNYFLWIIIIVVSGVVAFWLIFKRKK